jgi:hypothetical protein
MGGFSGEAFEKKAKVKADYLGTSAVFFGGGC